MIPSALLKKFFVTVLYFSEPAVSHICNLTFCPFVSKEELETIGTLIFLNLKSMPIVAMFSFVNYSSTNRVIKAVLPTEDSPIVTTRRRIPFSYDVNADP